MHMTLTKLGIPLQNEIWGPLFEKWYEKKVTLKALTYKPFLAGYHGDFICLWPTPLSEHTLLSVDALGQLGLSVQSLLAAEFFLLLATMQQPAVSWLREGQSPHPTVDE